jgi:tRNA(adenine34) deaminase
MEKEKIEKYMKISINEARKAYKKNEIPVGAIIVLNDEIISKSYNKKNFKNIVTEHAEISAIIKANKKLNNWRLNEAILFTTLEPCKMCKEVIKESRIKEIYYAAKNENEICFIQDNKYIQIENELIIKEATTLIKDIFKKIRKNDNNK